MNSSRTLESASDWVYRWHPIVDLEQVLTADRHIGDNEVHKVIRLENIKTEVLNKCIKNIRGFGLEIVYNELDNPNHSSQTQTIDTEMKKMDRNC